MGIRLAKLVAVLVAALLLMPTVTLADGDPASDVLLGENVFYPYMPQVSGALQKTLNAEAAAAARAHFPLKVALIASPVDLGVIPYMFGKPQMYADFLDQEISFEGKQALLVVMWDGFGVQGLAAPAKAAALSLRKPAGKTSDDLASAAITAVATLARAAGHPVAAAGARAGGDASSGTATTTIVLIALVAAAVGTSIAIAVIRRRHAVARS